MALTKNKAGEWRTFWQHAENTSEKVKSWPEWKRNVRLTKYSKPETDREEKYIAEQD